MKRQERKELIEEQRRQQILDAALRLFPKKGFDLTSMDDIAEEAGVSIGTIYRYYKSKRDLLMAFVDNSITKPTIALFDATEAQSNEDTLIKVSFDARLNESFDNAEKYLLLFAEISRDHELRKMHLDRAMNPLLKHLEADIEARVDSGLFRDVNSKIAVRAIIGMIIGLMLLYKLEGKKGVLQKTPRDLIVSEALDILFHGLEEPE